MSQAQVEDLRRRLAEAEATITALVSGQVDTVAGDEGPLLLAKAQAALRESEARLAITLDSIGDAVLATDLRGLVTRMNPVAEQLTGWPAAEAIGKPVDSILQVLCEETRALLPMRLDDLIAGSAVAASRGQLVARNGGERAIAQKASPIRTTDGEVVGVVVAFRDVTEQRLMEGQLRLADRMVSMGTLAAGVAHEINNPLAALIGNLELLAEDLGDGNARRLEESGGWASVRDILADAREAAERVRTITRDLKLFSRVEEDRRERVDVQRLMESSLRLAWNEVRHRARLVKDFHPVPAVEANEARLGQALVNLIVNAAHAIPEGRADQNEIRLGTGTDTEGRAVIEVRDTGTGIPPHVLPRIFDPFFTTKKIGAGTGLGLAICQRIVSDLGGQIAVHSRVGEGTTFRVVLPASRGVRPAAPETSPTHRPSRTGARVLVIDDEPLVQSLVLRALSGAHEVTGELRAEGALARIAGGARFDVILCDVMMPQMTGMDLFQRLTELAPEQAERVAFLTGGAFTAKAVAFLESTTKPIINKPFDTRILRAVVDEIAGRGAT